jgi:hypothetical protein
MPSPGPQVTWGVPRLSNLQAARAPVRRRHGGAHPGKTTGLAGLGVQVREADQLTSIN